jgi:glycolate oxidase iron-sulfur subunit
MDVDFAEINSDTLDVLLQHGCEVIVPRNQGCCGSMQAHNGEMKKGKELALKTMKLFSNFEYDFLISNSAGCGAYMKEYGHEAENLDKEERAMGNGQPSTGNLQLATEFSKKVRDLSEFLYETGFRSENYEFDGKVTYHDACHLAHTQKITVQPREIIKSIKSVEYTELDESSWCCGSAGIYNVARYDDSLNFLVRKMGNLQKTAANIVVMGNPGCMGQIKHGTQKYNFNIEVLHLATFLNRSYLGQKK